MAGEPPPPGFRRSFVEEQYPAWVRNNRLRPSDLRRQRHEVESLSYKPLVSVVVPVYNPEREWLEAALDSVMAQVYPNWELCAHDDASTANHVGEILDRYTRLDGRIKTTRGQRNTGICEASNAALSMATGEFVALLDHDDELAPDALFEVVKVLQEHPEADLVYSDEDMIDESRQQVRPPVQAGLVAGDAVSAQLRDPPGRLPAELVGGDRRLQAGFRGGPGLRPGATLYRKDGQDPAHPEGPLPLEGGKGIGGRRRGGQTPHPRTDPESPARCARPPGAQRFCGGRVSTTASSGRGSK